MTTTMHVYCLRDRVDFGEMKTPVPAHVAAARRKGGFGAAVAALRRYGVALLAAQQHPLWETERLGDPVALTSAADGSTPFLIPLRDGGPTFYVSETEDFPCDGGGPAIHDL